MISIIGAFAFSIAVIFYILIILGFPLGEFAMGGKYKVVPLKLRGVFVISVLIQIFAIIILLQTGGIIPLYFSDKITRNICLFFSIYLTLNVLMNFLSKSKKEKYIVGPLSLITALCFWLTFFN